MSDKTTSAPATGALKENKALMDLSLNIPPKALAIVAGKGNANLKEMRAREGITLCELLESATGPSTLALRGTEEAVLKARAAVSKLLPLVGVKASELGAPPVKRPSKGDAAATAQQPVPDAAPVPAQSVAEGVSSIGGAAASGGAGSSVAAEAEENVKIPDCAVDAVAAALPDFKLRSGVVRCELWSNGLKVDWLVLTASGTAAAVAQIVSEAEAMVEEAEEVQLKTAASSQRAASASAGSDSDDIVPLTELQREHRKELRGRATVTGPGGVGDWHSDKVKGKRLEKEKQLKKEARQDREA